MIVEYIQEALGRAKYEIIDNEEKYYGKVSQLKGVWATGKTLEECRENLYTVLEGWILIRFKKGLHIPSLGNKQIEELKEVAIRE
ncbi:type II toxin-antitoxin system HicB family antitoxin [bacterium]|nr:type II toxin-antitoxin system HicB family antitoxin [bacterium]